MKWDVVVQSPKDECYRVGSIEADSEKEAKKIVAKQFQFFISKVYEANEPKPRE